MSGSNMRKRGRLPLICALAAIAAAVLAVLFLLPAISRTADPVQPAAPDAGSPAETADVPEGSWSPGGAGRETPAPAPQMTVVPPEINALFRPDAEQGWLPVFRHSLTNEKVIAITIDDCYQAENLRSIIDAASASGGKLTIFPIGENVLREKVGEALRSAWEQGFELENHTFTHNGLYSCSNEDLAREIYYQNLALSKILGVEYRCHFLRPKGGDAKNDQRMHAYAAQMGYYGIAHWNVDGSRSSRAALADSLKPGAIYLFHTTDSDAEMLRDFIPYAVSMGYRLVTLNEMFGYGENETSALEIPIEEHAVPPLEPYTVVPVTYKKPAYAYGVVLIQQKLIALGLLDGEPDGVFGTGTAKAVRAFQKRAGLPATGEADPVTQSKLGIY